MHIESGNKQHHEEQQIAPMPATQPKRIWADAAPHALLLLKRANAPRPSPGAATPTRSSPASPKAPQSNHLFRLAPTRYALLIRIAFTKPCWARSFRARCAYSLVANIEFCA